MSNDILQFNDYNNLHNYLFKKSIIWFNSYNKQQNKKIIILDSETKKQKWEHVFPYSRKRLIKYVQNLKHNLDEKAIENIINSVDNFMQTIYKDKDKRAKFISDKNKKYYEENIKKENPLTQEQINKEFQTKRRNDSKKLVLEVANNLKKNSVKITNQNILNVMQGMENGLKLASIKKYVKELKEENKI